MVACRTPDVGVAGEHPVVLVRVGRDDVMNRIEVAQRPVHRPAITPCLGGGQLESGRCVVRHNARHVLWIRHHEHCVNGLVGSTAGVVRPAAQGGSSAGR